MTGCSSDRRGKGVVVVKEGFFYFLYLTGGDLFPCGNGDRGRGPLRLRIAGW
jgi:hypothetical protein